MKKSKDVLSSCRVYTDFVFGRSLRSLLLHVKVCIVYSGIHNLVSLSILEDMLHYKNCACIRQLRNTQLSLTFKTSC